MRRPTGQEPKQSIRFVQERHREIARRDVLGQKPQQIAAELEISECRLSIIRNSSMYIAMRDELSALADKEAADINGRIRKLLPRSVDVLDHVLQEATNPFNEKLQVKVAQDIMDRTGFGRETKVTQDGEIRHKIAAEEVFGRALKSLKENDAKVRVGVEIEAGGVERGGGEATSAVDTSNRENLALEP